jgi:hypothetical protein
MASIMSNMPCIDECVFGVSEACRFGSNMHSRTIWFLGPLHRFNVCILLERVWVVVGVRTGCTEPCVMLRASTLGGSLFERAKTEMSTCH